MHTCDASSWEAEVHVPTVRGQAWAILQDPVPQKERKNERQSFYSGRKSYRIMEIDVWCILTILGKVA